MLEWPKVKKKKKRQKQLGYVGVILCPNQFLVTYYFIPVTPNLT